LSSRTYWSIIIGSRQSLSSHKSGSFFERFLQNHQNPIQPASVRILYSVLYLQSRSYNKGKWRFCSFACGRETFEMGFIFLRLVFQRSNFTLKLAKFRSVFEMLFFYFTHTDVRERRFWEFYICVTTAMTVVTESSSNITERLKMSVFTVQFLQFFFSDSNLYFQDLKIFYHVLSLAVAAS